MLFIEAMNIARVSPLLITATAILGYFLTYEKTFLLLLIGFTGNTAINYILKHYIVKPIMGDKKYPVIGTGSRPTGAKNCGLFNKSSITAVKSYGMPSGHSQMAGFFTSYSISKLADDRVGIPLFITISGILGASLVFIMYSRVYSKCHTIQQTLAGSILGIILGNLFFHNKYVLEKYIPSALIVN